MFYRFSSGILRKKFYQVGLFENYALDNLTVGRGCINIVEYLLYRVFVLKNIMNPFKVTRFMWEPKGNKLCALHGESSRVSCSIYNVERGKVSTLVTIPDLRSIDCIFWSPAGQYCPRLQNIYRSKKDC